MQLCGQGSLTFFFVATCHIMHHTSPPHPNHIISVYQLRKFCFTIKQPHHVNKHFEVVLHTQLCLCWLTRTVSSGSVSTGPTSFLCLSCSNNKGPLLFCLSKNFWIHSTLMQNTNTTHNFNATLHLDDACVLSNLSCCL